MQEWDPEHFTNFAQLCEVSLNSIRDKADADYLYLWLKSPEPKLYRFQLEQGLTTLDLAHLDALPIPHTLIDKAIHQGQLMIEPVHQPPDGRDESEAQPPRLLPPQASLEDLRGHLPRNPPPDRSPLPPSA